MVVCACACVSVSVCEREIDRERGVLHRRDKFIERRLGFADKVHHGPTSSLTRAKKMASQAAHICFCVGGTLCMRERFCVRECVGVLVEGVCVRDHLCAKKSMAGQGRTRESEELSLQKAKQKCVLQLLAEKREKD